MNTRIERQGEDRQEKGKDGGPNCTIIITYKSVVFFDTL